MLNRIQRLREISSECLASGQLSPENAQWLGSHLERFLQHDCSTLEEAFGLRFPRGGVPWWREEAIRRRDQALRDMAEAFHGSLALSARSRAIYRKAMRFETTLWRSETVRAEMPESFRGTEREYLWLAFKSGATMPVCERQLRTILGG